jgi:hypothetical protein
MKMGHIFRVHSREQYKAALHVLDYLPGTFHSQGPSDSAVLFVTDEHYQALVEAGVIPANGVKEKGRGKKTVGKKAKS